MKIIELTFNQIKNTKKIQYEFYQYSQLTSVIIKFKLVTLIVKQYSNCMDLLEQKIRRSSRLKDSSALRDFLNYAPMVRDQDQVYAYMEQNQIGIQEPQFWAAKLRLLKNKCQLKQFMKVVKQINRNQGLKNHPKYWLITQIQNQLEHQLQKILRKTIKSKRSAKQYEVLNYSDVQRETRKFGKVQVYVDPQCRMQYRLQDLIQFVTTRLNQWCEIQKNTFERILSNRPLSFLGKNKDKINKISQQMLGFASRPNRFSNKRMTEGRMSIVGRQSNKVDGQLIITPDFKKKSFSKQNKQNYKTDKQKLKLNLLDSFEILKNAVKKKGSNKKQHSSQSQNPQFDISRISSVKKQKIRNSPHRSNKDQIFSQPDLQFDRDSIYSFGESQKNPSSEPRKSKNRFSSKNIQIKKQFEGQKYTISINQSLKDFAFLEETQQQESNGLINAKNSKQSLDLQNVIKQIQMQKYESQTMSEIDSNKENNTLTGEQDFLNFNEEQIRGNKQRERRKFQTLKKERQVSIKIKNSKKFKDQDNNSNEMDQSSQGVYKEYLYYLDDKNESEPRLSLSQNERKKKNRISRISEERSYSFSETRPKSRNNS